MDMVLYDKPLRIELMGFDLYVNGERVQKTVRTLDQMKKTLLSYKESAGNPDMYFMYKDVFKRGDIRFDITVIPAFDIQGECGKTHGHYHPGSEDGPAYPEVYQVLRGSAVFVLQRKNRNGSVDVMFVNAKQGDTVLLPPGYGHVSINNGEEALVLANLVYDRFDSMYGEYDLNQGAAFYYLKGGEIAQNSNYIVQNSEHLSAKELNARFNFTSKDILNEFYENEGKFEFLKRPKLLFK